MTDFVPAVPGSRSIAARALICAALAQGQSRVTNLPDCDDTDAIRACLAGATRAPFAPRDGVLDCNASGTTMRFIAALSLLTDRPMVLTGTPRLLERPMAGLADALAAVGKQLEDRGALRTITGTPVIPAQIQVQAATSGQFVSGLLMALAACGQVVELRAVAPASRAFIMMTVHVMRAFGAQVQVRDDCDDLVFSLPGTGYQGAAFAVEPDVMSANYFMAAAAITGAPVFVPGLRRDTIQGDVALLDVLEAMGATVDEYRGGLRCHRESATPLRGCDADLADMPDMSLTIGALAAVAAGPTTMTSARILQYKESDRLAAMTTELRKVGAHVDVSDDSDIVTVKPQLPLRSAAIDTYDDHRMAMAFGLLTLVEPGIVINDPQCVTKTWPSFFAELERFRAVAYSE